jgi:hypothetical protein
MALSVFTMSVTGVSLTKPATATTTAEYTVNLVPFGTANLIKPKAAPLQLVLGEADAEQFVAGKEYDITITETTP